MIIQNFKDKHLSLLKLNKKFKKKKLNVKYVSLIDPAHYKI